MEPGRTILTGRRFEFQRLDALNAGGGGQHLGEKRGEAADLSVLSFHFRNDL
jgi:hypothetical protein